MQYALTLTPYSQFSDHHDLLEVVRTAAALGFTAVSFGDHIAPPADNQAPTYYYDPLVMAAVLTAHVETISVIFNVLVIPYRNPLNLAKSLATLDVLSNGRVIAGIGSGWLADEFAALGVSFAERGAITDEYVRAMQTVWRSSPSNFSGRYISFTDVVSQPHPINHRQPRLWVAVDTGPRGIRRALELGADGASFLIRSVEQLATDVATLRDGLRARSASVDAFAINTLVFYGRWEQGSRHGQFTPDTILSADRAKALGQVETFERIGVTHLCVRFFADASMPLVRQMERFAADLIN